MPRALISGITGQDGAAFAPGDEAGEPKSLPGDLAARLYAADDSISHVFIASNQVVVERKSGWDDGSLGAATDVVTAFFVFYTEA